MSKIIEDRYLGDGVYASFDGYNIVLDLRGQEQPPRTRIALDPDVMSALMHYDVDCMNAATEAAQRAKRSDEVCGND